MRPSKQLSPLMFESSIENSEMQTRSFITLKEAMKRICTKWDWLSKKHFTGSGYEERCCSTILAVLAIGFFSLLLAFVCATLCKPLFFLTLETVVSSSCSSFDYSAWMAKILATPEHDKEASFANFSSALALPSKMKEACSN